MFGRYTKFITTLLATVGAALVPALSDDVVTVTEWVNVVIILFGALTVLGATNLPEGVWKYAKSIFAAGSAATVAVSSLLGDGITASEWIQVGIAAAGAVGVLALRNAGSTTDGASTTATGMPTTRIPGPA